MAPGCDVRPLLLFAALATGCLVEATESEEDQEIAQTEHELAEGTEFPGGRTLNYPLPLQATTLAAGTRLPVEAVLDQSLSLAPGTVVSGDVRDAAGKGRHHVDHVGEEDRHAAAREALGQELQRARLSGARRAGDHSVPIHHPQRHAHRQFTDHFYRNGERVAVDADVVALALDEEPVGVALARPCGLDSRRIQRLRQRRIAILLLGHDLVSRRGVISEDRCPGIQMRVAPSCGSTVAHLITFREHKGVGCAVGDVLDSASAIFENEPICGVVRRR